MSPWTLLLVVLATYAGAAEDKATKRLQWMQTHAEKGEGVIRMNGSQLKQYVNNGPRPYHVFLMLTALAPRFGCTVCEKLETIFEAVGRATHHHSYSQDSPPVFVVEVDFADAQEAFQSLGLSSVPVHVFVPATTEKSRPNLSSLLSRKSSSSFRFKPTMDAQDIVDFINEQAGIDAAIPLTAEEKRERITLYGGGSAAALIALILFWRNRHNTLIYSVCALVFYAFCISGGMYNYIRKTPWSQGEQLFNPSGRDQYGLEGYIMGGSALLAGVCVVLLCKVHQPESKSCLWWLFNSLLSLCILCVAILNIVTVYTSKNRAYKMGQLGFFEGASWWVPHRNPLMNI